MVVVVDFLRIGRMKSVEERRRTSETADSPDGLRLWRGCDGCGRAWE